MPPSLMSGTPWNTRFAPSPTGAMHLGNARTAILNWLIARQSGGTFSLRLEDTDQERSTFASEASIFSALDWMGLVPRGPVLRQSTRLEIYRKTAFELWDKGLAYPCFCTEAELEHDRETAAAQGLPPRYTRRCARLTREEARKKREEGVPFTLRFKVGDDPAGIHFRDLLKGEMDIPTQAFGDFVILRSNGWPSYNLAVVVDDLAMDINLVVRGEDHLTNTARQLLIYRALEQTPPHFAHHGLLVDRDHKKLSKRAGARSLPQLMNQGIHPLALVHYLGGLSGAIKGRGIVSSLEELVQRFNPLRLGRGNAMFLEEDLITLDQSYWHRLPPADLLPRIRGLESLGRPWQDMSEDRQTALIGTVQQNAANGQGFAFQLAPFLTEETTYTLEALRTLRLPTAREVIQTLKELLETAAKDLDQPISREALNTAFRECGAQAGVKGKELYLPLRMALMGTSQGPELKAFFQALPLSTILHRLETALEAGGK